MNQFKYMGSLTYTMLDSISNAKTKDVNYEVATILVENFSKLKTMTITEMAELCYVSPSTISRFCKYLGFANFSEFKEYLDKDFSVANDYTKKYRNVLKQDFEIAVKEYHHQMIKNLDSVYKQLDFDVLNNVVEKIQESRKISFFGVHFLYSVGKFFQSKMILMEKYIENYFYYEDQLEAAKKLDQDSLVIILSVGASYNIRYPEVMDVILQSGAKVLLITQNTNTFLASNADYVLKCGESNLNNEGKYSALYVMDLLVMAYAEKYISINEKSQ